MSRIASVTQLTLTLFGGFTAVTPDGTTPHFPTDKARSLLAYLALMADRPVRREALAGLFWPERSESLARQNLRQTLSRLRTTLDAAQPGLGEALLTVTRQEVELHGYHAPTDAAQFWEHVTAVKTHLHGALAECSACLVRLETAVTLYRRGDFLAGLSLPDAPPFEEWLRLQREQLYQYQLTALDHLTTAYEQQRVFEAAYRYALWQIEMEPWRETAHRQAMRLLVGNGQRSEALAQYEICCQTLEEELGVEPSAETMQLWQQIRDSAYQSAAAHRTQSHHFPHQLTPFIGREADLAQILTMLSDKTCRILSLIGPGGMGKTRLSLQIGQLLAQEGNDGLPEMPFYKDGAYFIPLAHVTDVELLVTAVTRGLALQLAEYIPPRQQLLSYLQDKTLLLVCDNFEQVADGASLLLEIIRRAPHVQILLTSQQPLNVQAEWRFVVGGLEYAAGDEASEAVQMFLQSARRVAPGFRLGAADVPAVLALCRLLDGMPLALEIAASWVRMMDSATILQETQRSLDFLVSALGDVPPRHQSVRAVLTHTWQQLAPHLQEALRHIALFAGGFTLEAALAILPELSMTDMAALLDKSLLSWQPDGRYQMHQLLRHFVHQQPPEAQAEAVLFRQRYCHYYLNFVAAQEAFLQGQNPLQAIETIQRDVDNVRQAWQWALQDRQPQWLSAGVYGLGRFYHLVGLFEEAEQRFAAALSVVKEWPSVGETAVLQTQLPLQLSHFLGQSGQYQPAIRQAEEAQALAAQINRPNLLAWAYSLEGEWRRHLNELNEARRCLDTAVATYPTLDGNRGYAHTLNEIGLIHLIQSQYDAALAAFNQARQIYTAVDDQTEVAITLGNLAEVYRLKADYEQALDYCQQALTVAETIGYTQAIVKISLVFGTVQMEQGHTEEARTTYQNALALAQRLGYVQGIIQGQLGLGTLCLSQSKLDEAEDLLRTVHVQADKAGLQNLVAVALGKQGIIHAHRGEQEAAIAAYQQAAQLWRLLNNQTELSLNLSNLGNIYLRLGEYERALHYFEQALTAVQSVGARQVAANVMLRLGNVYKRLGNYERAIACFEQSLTTYQALQHKSGMAASLGWLGLMNQEMGDYAAAQVWYEQAMPLSEELGDRITITIWLANRAQVAMHLGQREQAEHLVQQAVDLCRTLGSTRFLPDTLITQARIFFAHEKVEQAQLVLAEALPLSESTGDQQIQFDGRLLQARLSARFGDKQTAVAQLQNMMADFASDTYQAQLHYYLWQIEGDTAVRETAVRLYEAVLIRTPNYELQQQLQILRTDSLS